jgi:hypothetical protein
MRSIKSKQRYGWLCYAKPSKRSVWLALSSEAGYLCREEQAGLVCRSGAAQAKLALYAKPWQALDDKRCYASDVSRAMAGSIYAKQSLCIQSMRSECWLYYAKPDAKQVLAFLCEAGCLCQI